MQFVAACVSTLLAACVLRACVHSRVGRRRGDGRRLPPLRWWVLLTGVALGVLLLGLTAAYWTVDASGALPTEIVLLGMERRSAVLLFQLLAVAVLAALITLGVCVSRPSHARRGRVGDSDVAAAVARLEAAAQATEAQHAAVQQAMAARLGACEEELARVRDQLVAERAARERSVALLEAKIWPAGGADTDPELVA